ncbi:MAG: minor capsid protein [Fusobacterium gastrosuis]|uniref:phage head morphogenesis protein n=1 Tax=Fusobacterium gastrosuis TaxID=1755100 RepID=UPI002A851ED7|nr:minor capsid protein [Fusobacterium gastrosuis]
MFPKNIENKLRTTLQFYTNLKIKRAKKRINNGQLPLFELTEEEKKKCLKELVKRALEINKSVWEAMYEQLELKKIKESLNKQWVKSLFGIMDKNIEFDKLQQIRIDRVSEQLKKWNINIKFENGKINKTQLKALKSDVATYRNNKQIREIITNFESGKFEREDIKTLEAYLKRRNENIARNETGNLYAQEVKDLMIENNLEYYTWRTVGDDRVRDEHADKDGKIFSIHDTPLPGEDFNCRCSAEPIKNK